MLSVLLLLAIALIFTLTYNRFFHPLRGFPGPFWAAQTDAWRAYHLCTKRLPDTLEAVHARYGPVVRVGPNDLSFQSVAAIAPIYKSGRRLIKSSFYDGFTAFIPNLFGTQDEEVSTARPRNPSLKVLIVLTAAPSASRPSPPSDGPQLLPSLAP